MFVALTKTKERVSIEMADKNDKYFCPICGEELSLSKLHKQSLIRTKVRLLC